MFLIFLQDLFNVLIQFDLLNEKMSNKTEENEAAKRLNELMKEAEEMKRQMEDKLQQIEGYINNLMPVVLNPAKDLNERWLIQ